MEIDAAIAEVKEEFPFSVEYMRGKEIGYQTVSQLIGGFADDSTLDILSIGSGPCDFEAIFSKQGHSVTAVDDLRDKWHVLGDNTYRIREFTSNQGIEFYQKQLGTDDFTLDKKFDVVCALDIIEHLGNPRDLLNIAGRQLRAGGMLVILTPNEAHLANRLNLLLGKSVNKDAEYLFWNIGEYRSHIKEYTVDEMQRILRLAGFQNINIKTVNKLSRNVENNANSLPMALTAKIYIQLSNMRNTFRDTQIATAIKPESWTPTDDSVEEFARHYHYINTYNLDSLSDGEIIEAIHGQE